MTEVGAGAWSYPSQPTRTRTVPPLAPTAVRFVRYCTQKDLKGEDSSALPAIVVAWDEPADTGGDAIVEYYVQRAAAPLPLRGAHAHSKWITAARIDAQPGGSGACSSTVGGLQPGSEYFVRACAKSAAGTSPWSAMSLPIRVPPIAPAVPTRVSARVRLCVHADVSWAAPVTDGGDRIVSYEVKAVDSQYQEWVHPVVATGSRPCATSMTISGLIELEHYQFAVRALNAAGRSEWSELSDVVRAESTRHPPPAQPRVVRTTSTSVTLQWERASGAACECFEVIAYELDVKLVRVNVWARVELSPLELATALEKQQAVVRGLLPAELYCFRVRSRSENDLVSDFSLPSDDARTNPTYPDAPLQPILVATAPLLKRGELRVEWDELKCTGGSAVTHYEFDLIDLGSVQAVGAQGVPQCAWSMR